MAVVYKVDASVNMKIWRKMMSGEPDAEEKNAKNDAEDDDKEEEEEDQDGDDVKMKMKMRC